MSKSPKPPKKGRHGGARQGSGRKKKEPPQQIVVMTRQAEAKGEPPPQRAEYLGPMPEENKKLTPMQVLEENMRFYHAEAHARMVLILRLPTLTHDEQTDAQFEALRLLAEEFRMRDKASEVARDLARYMHRPMAPKPYTPEEEPKPEGEQGKIIAVIPVNPVAMAAFRRAAQGLPPEPRKTL